MLLDAQTNTYLGDNSDNHATFIRPGLIKENCFHSYIHISTLLINYTHMKMTYLSQPGVTWAILQTPMLLNNSLIE